MSALLEGLNPEQRLAVSHLEGPLLVLAGAGSGKTRVITHRVAWLVEEAGVSPSEILAVTFTNKAAGEMRARVGRLLGTAGDRVWISTFHGAGVRALREHGEAVGVPRNFVIYDDRDQLALCKSVMKDRGIDPSSITPRMILSRIDHAKSCGLGPEDIDATDSTGERVAEVFRLYQAALRSCGAVDFGDLLTETVAMLRDHPAILDLFRRRLRFLMVDEFQDTSPVQYELIRLLAGERANLVVVGDDDQSIYGWRGADVRNILSFEADYPTAKVVRLEQNYRSTQVILDAAHAVISKSPARKEKRLWTAAKGGALVEVLACEDDKDEARRVARRMDELSADLPLGEIAVLYRTNAMSRVLEDALRATRIPYQIVRGRSFYDRAEIKDLTAYLRLAVNPDSDADLLRVINTPRRGIGAKTIERVRAEATRNGTSAWAALSALPGDIKAAAASRLDAFAALISRLHGLVLDSRSAKDVVNAALMDSGLISALQEEGTEEASERMDNLTQLLRVAQEKEEEGYTLMDLLDEMALLGDADQRVEGDRVSLMTLHSAKGLEFEAVFMVGMEEMSLPHARVFSEDGWREDVDAMSEERRLCYVGFTRARQRLILGVARSRFVMGAWKTREPSRFLEEIPGALLSGGRASFERGRSWGSGSARGSSFTASRYRGSEANLDVGDVVIDYSFDQRPSDEGELPRPGGRVRHRSWGEGVITEVDGFGSNTRIVVRFDHGEKKRILARYLELI